MRGCYNQYLIQKGHTSNLTKAVEDARAIRAEEAELRLARIMNGKEPSHQNGTSLVQESVK